MGGKDRARTRSVSVSVKSDNVKVPEMTKKSAKNCDTAEDMLLEDKLSKILYQIEITNKGIENLNNKFDRLNGEINQVKKDIDKNTKRIDSVCKRVDSLEQYSRGNNLRIYGIPSVPDENTKQVIMQLINGTLKMKVDDREIIKAYRLGAQKGNVPAAVLVRFGSRDIKNEVYNQRKGLKGTRITIREDLTEERMRLLKIVMERFGRRNVWTQDGKIKWVENDIKFTISNAEQWERTLRSMDNAGED